MERVKIPGIRNPKGYTKHIAFLAGGEYFKSKKNTPIARIGSKHICYFGRSNIFAAFENGKRVNQFTNPISAALWLSHN